jgi:exosortase sorting signal-containing protein
MLGLNLLSARGKLKGGNKMKIINRVSVFVVTFLMVGLFFLALTGNEASGVASPPGCCTTEMDGGVCAGCPGGESCLTSQEFCSSEGGFFSKGVCFEDGEGAVCGVGVVTEGCCVVASDQCVDGVLADECFFGEFPDAELWVSGEACINVPQCSVVRNIPTLSQWGLIAMAGIFILVGIWAITRKKAEA